MDTQQVTVTGHRRLPRGGFEKEALELEPKHVEALVISVEYEVHGGWVRAWTPTRVKAPCICRPAYLW